MTVQFRRGLSLIEVVVALFLVGIAVLPLIPVFSQSYVFASRQVDQETAIKIAEATANQLMSVPFDFLNTAPPGSQMNLRYEVPNAPPVNITMPLSWGAGAVNGSASFKIAQTPFTVGVASHRLYDASVSPMVFQYYDTLNSQVASYVCTDDFLQLDVTITYTPGKVPIVASLTTCRANMTQ